MIESSLRFKGLVIAAAVGLLVFGAMQLLNAPVDSLPEFKPTIVEIQTEALGLSAEEVEQFITVPLEQDLLNGVAFIEDIESVSLPGLSSVVIRFEDGTPLLDARQVVAERLTQAVGVAGLPNVADPPQMLQPLSSTNRVSIVRLTPRELTPIQASVLARWVIGPRLLGVEGVANVSIFGQRERQLQVLVDPTRLAEHDVTLSQVVHTSGNALEVSPLSFLEASKPGTGGFIDTLNQRFQVFHEQPIETAEELELVPMEDEAGNAVFVNGAPLTLGEVATVVEDHQPLIGDAMCASDDCLLLVIEKFPGADTTRVAEEIDAAIDAMRPGLDGIDIDTSIFRPSEYVETAFSNLAWAVALGSLLGAIALLALLLRWRTILVIVAVLATALAGMGVVLVLGGAPINLMVLSGLVLGLIVVIGDVVEDVNGLVGRMKAPDDRGQVPQARRIRLLMTKTRSAAVYAGFIVAAVIVPAFFLRGVAGAFLPPILLTYLLAIVVSTFLALTVTPALASVILDGAGDPPAARRLREFFDRRMASGIGSMRPATIALVALVVAGTGSAIWLQPALQPQLEERDIVVELEAPFGTSLDLMRDMTADMITALAEVPGVRTVGAHLGRAITSDQVTDVNEAEIWVNLDAGTDYDQAVAAISEIAEANQSLEAAVTTHSSQRIDALLQRTQRDIVVRVYGEDPAILREKAQEIQTRLAEIDGVDNPKLELRPHEETLLVRADLEQAQAVGLKPGDIRRQAAILLNGITVGNLFDEQKVFDVVVWGAPELRGSTEAVENLLIETASSERVPLHSVADVEVAMRPAVIRHESVFTYRDVTADVVGRSVSAVAADVDAVLVDVDFPLEHHAELLGGLSELRTHRAVLALLWSGAAVFVFLLLQAGLNSWKLAGASMLALAASVAGGLVAVLVTGRSLALGSVAGLFVVFGLAVRHYLLTIRHYQRLQTDEGRPFDRDMVVRGTRDRLLPVITTITVSLLFLLPIALRGPTAGFEVLQPMSVVVIGGLLAIAVTEIAITPAIYLRLGSPADAKSFGEELFDVSLPEMEVRTELGAE